MVHTILGAPAFRTGSDEYFRRHDGAAVTTEDFLAAMRDTSGKDLGQFQRWYDQAGTPTLRVQSRFEAGTLTLSVAQSCPDTPGQSAKAPFHIPVLLGLLDRDGSSLVSDGLRWEGDCEVERRDDSLLLHLKRPTADVRFTGLARQPEVSFLRGFSAPVRVDFPRPAASLAFLAEHDPDGFAAWDALQTLLVAELTGHERGRPYAAELLESIGRLLGNALGGPLDDPERNFVLVAKLSLPSESYLFEQVERIDVERLCAARDALGDALARTHVGRWEALLEASASDGPYAPEARSMSRRALHHTALGYLARVLDPADLEARLAASFDAADNLSDRRALIACAVDHLPDSAVTAALLDRFYERWQNEALVVNQWLSVQAAGTHCDVSRLQQLVAHPAFTLKNPNKVRAVLGAFAGLNARNFHAADGSGYEYLADRVLELDGINPQMASALAKPLARWRRYKGPRARLMSGVVKRIAAEPSLSRDVYEVVSKALL
jgi:aminopeptidase N